MAHELIYTSAQRGLRPGTRGFCTVAYTEGMRPESIQLLESLSAYRNLFAVHDQRTALSPTAYSHYRYTIAARNVSILSRVGPTQADHTYRTNKLAHHVVLTGRERVLGGPAWLCCQEGFFVDSWSGEPCRIATPKAIPESDYQGTRATAWEAVMGDAGWAGVLAYAFLRRPRQPAYLIFPPDMDVLKLLVEATALLPPEQRWHVTFNTYYCTLPAGTTCCWRCCVPGSPCLTEASRDRNTLIIDLTQAAQCAVDNDLVRCARSGEPLPDLPDSRYGALASGHASHTG